MPDMRRRKIPAATRRRIAKRSQKGWDIKGWLGIAIGGIAAVAAVVGVWTWVAEAPDRQWEREVRSATLEQSARQILKPETGTLEPSYSVQMAIMMLSELDVPVEISADRVNLAGLFLPCGAYRITGKEVYFDMTSVHQAFMVLKAPNVVIRGSQFRHSEIVVRSDGREDSEAPPVAFIWSRALDTHFMFDDGAAIGLSTFEDSKILSWFGEVNFDYAGMLNFVALPSVSKSSWQTDEYPALFEPTSVDLARENATYDAQLPEGRYDASRYLTEQRLSSTDVTADGLRLSEEWSKFCEEKDGGIYCRREDYSFFEEHRLSDEFQRCSKSNEYRDFDPKTYGDAPVLLRPRRRP